MTRVELLDSLVYLTEEETADIIMPVRPQKDDQDDFMLSRPAKIYKMRLPDSKAATKKAPYIIHQLITSKDVQLAGQRITSTATVRTIFCVYCDDEMAGALHLLNLMERMRIRLLRDIVVGKQFRLDLETGVEYIIYPENSAPYFAGEMVTDWELPAVQREVNYGSKRKALYTNGDCVTGD